MKVESLSPVLKLRNGRHFLISSLIDHSPSTNESKGHGVTAFRKYTLKYQAMARTSRIMPIGVQNIPNRGPPKRTLTQTRRIGQPPQPILGDDRQLLWLVSNGQTKSANTYENRRSTAQRCILILLVDQKIGWFKQETVENIQE